MTKNLEHEGGSSSEPPAAIPAEANEDDAANKVLGPSELNEPGEASDTVASSSAEPSGIDNDAADQNPSAPANPDQTNADAAISEVVFAAVALEADGRADDDVAGEAPAASGPYVPGEIPGKESSSPPEPDEDSNGAAGRDRPVPTDLGRIGEPFFITSPFPVGAGHAADDLSRRMEQMGIECPVHASIVTDTLILEPPLRMLNGVHNVAITRIGAFSYSWSRIGSSVRSIGRYCSIAGQVTFGEVEHPTTWLSTSSFTYDQSWMWKDFATAQDCDYQARIFPNHQKHPTIRIGNDVWIGLQAYIKGGVQLGDGCIVGAGAVVTKDVPPYAIVVGNPARIVRYRFDEATVSALLELRWWQHAFIDFAGLPIDDVPGMIASIGQLRSENALRMYSPTCLRLRPEQHGAVQ